MLDPAVLNKFIADLNTVEAATHAAKGFTHPPDKWKVGKVGRKFCYLDCGGSGAFLVEVATGELFNIKGYGTPDYNKKRKADLGNLATADPATVHSKRWNYLR